MRTRFENIWKNEQGSATLIIDKTVGTEIYWARLVGHFDEQSDGDCQHSEKLIGQACEFLVGSRPGSLVWDGTVLLSADPQIRRDLKAYNSVLASRGCKTAMILGSHLDPLTRAELQKVFRTAQTEDEAIEMATQQRQSEAGLPMRLSVNVDKPMFVGKDTIIGSSFGRTLIGMAGIFAAAGTSWTKIGSFLAGAAFVILVQIVWNLVKQ